MNISFSISNLMSTDLKRNL